MSVIKIENIKVTGWDVAIRGMRNPMNSWKLSDSTDKQIGEKDLDLMKRLCAAGPEHAKFLRMIRVSFDLTAPLYMLKEMDTYKVGVNCNSCSTMHKIMSKPFELTDFAFDKMSYSGVGLLREVIIYLNALRTLYLNYNDYKDEELKIENHDDNEEYIFGKISNIFPNKKLVWYEVIQLLPSSYMQKRTYEMSYQALVNIIKQRKNHKLEEWHNFCNTLLKECPYLEELIKEK